MKCNKCSKKEINRVDVEEIKCKSCKKKIKSRFTNVCYTCQVNKNCLICGEKI